MKKILISATIMVAVIFFLRSDPSFDPKWTNEEKIYRRVLNSPNKNLVFPFKGGKIEMFVVDPKEGVIKALVTPQRSDKCQLILFIGGKEDIRASSECPLNESPEKIFHQIAEAWWKWDKEQL